MSLVTLPRLAGVGQQACKLCASFNSQNCDKGFQDRVYMCRNSMSHSTRVLGLVTPLCYIHSAMLYLLRYAYSLRYAVCGFTLYLWCKGTHTGVITHR